MLVQVLSGGQVAEGLVRPDMLVGVSPFQKPLIDRPFSGAVRHVHVELLSVRAVTPLPIGVEFRRTERRKVQGERQSVAGWFEEGLKLAAAVDLQGPDAEREALPHGS